MRSSYAARNIFAGQTSSPGDWRPSSPRSCTSLDGPWLSPYSATCPPGPGHALFASSTEEAGAARAAAMPATHGRCDCDDSSFSLFIEAFQELGRAIYQDTGKLNCPPDEAGRQLCVSIQVSRDLAMQMIENLPSGSALELMERKAWYLDQMIRILPMALMDREVEEKRRRGSKGAPELLVDRHVSIG